VKQMLDAVDIQSVSISTHGMEALVRIAVALVGQHVYEAVCGGGVPC